MLLALIFLSFFLDKWEFEKGSRMALDCFKILFTAFIALLGFEPNVKELKSIVNGGKTDANPDSKKP